MKKWLETKASTGAAIEFGIAAADLDLIQGGSVCSTPGVAAAGIHAGVKAGDVPDVALIDTGASVPAAGVFTSNRAKAAPVLVSMEHLAGGRARAIVANSGCANACTGEKGIEDARSMASAAGDLFGCAVSDVLVASTGLIGYYLPIEPMMSAISAASVAGGPAAGHRAAKAIMTTDTVPKESAVRTEVGNRVVTVSGMAKGAAMLSPSMATMLAFITTDAAIESEALQGLLRSAVTATFNRISVDACQSTNDTVLALATGSAGNTPISGRQSEGYAELESALTEVCAQLALAMVCDAEGATRIAKISISGAASNEDALLAARGISSSVLVRCSLFGADPYWGRIASEIGASAATDIRSDRLSVAYGGIQVAKGGIGVDHDEGAVSRHMASAVVEIECDLGIGEGNAAMFTCDLAPGYIAENQGTS